MRHAKSDTMQDDSNAINLAFYKDQRKSNHQSVYALPVSSPQESVLLSLLYESDKYQLVSN